ncbi:MAG: hypothetical protein ACRBM6_05110 [Geminicoccales bacterium]
MIKSQIDWVGATDCRGKLTLLLAGLSAGDIIELKKTHLALKTDRPSSRLASLASLDVAAAPQPSFDGRANGAARGLVVRTAPGGMPMGSGLQMWFGSSLTIGKERASMSRLIWCW